MIAGPVVAYTAAVSVKPAFDTWWDVRALARGMRADDPNVRIESGFASADRHPETAVPYLIEAVGDPDAEVRASALRTLALFDLDRPWPAGLLNAKAGDPDARVRQEVARALGHVPVSSSARPQAATRDAGDSENVKILRRLVSDRDLGGRDEAVLAISRQDPDAAADALAKAIADKDRTVRYVALGTLLQILGAGDRPAAGPLARVPLPALEALWNDGNANDRAMAGLAIATIEGGESPRAASVLVGIVADAAVREDLRQWALHMLRKANPAAMVRARPDRLRQLGSSDENLRFVAGQ